MKKLLLIFTASLFLFSGAFFNKTCAGENIQDGREEAVAGTEVCFTYLPDNLYRIYAKEGYLTGIRLQKGETILYIGAGDTSRWIIDKAPFGQGTNQHWVIYLKPLKSGLTTNFVVNTNKHSYNIEAKSASVYNPSVSWSYPIEENMRILREEMRQEEIIQFDVLSVNSLNFEYEITPKDSGYSWTPKIVFDDGSKTYIKMPPSMFFSDSPALFLVNAKDGLALVNYRVKNGYYIVDRTFITAQMVNGKEIVQIKNGAKRR